MKFRAVAIRFTESHMELRLHGGSNIVVPRIIGVDETTPLAVIKEPGAKEAQAVMTMEQYLALTPGVTPQNEEEVEQSVPDHLEADLDTYADLPGFCPSM